MSEALSASHPVEPDRSETERFIATLAGSPDAAVTFQTYTDVEEWKKAHSNGKPWRLDSKGKPIDPLARWKHGTLAQHWNELVRMNAAGAGVFLMVNAGDGTGRTAENVRELRASFADDDNGTLTPAELELPPSMIVQSKHGIQPYWMLRPGEPLASFTPVQKALAAALHTDPSVNDLPRVMRLPGFVHQKDRADPFLVRVLQTSEAVYSINEVIESYGGGNGKAGHDVPVSQSTEVGDRAYSSVMQKARDYLRNVGPAVEGDNGDDLTYRVCAHLAKDLGLSDGDAMEVLRPWNRASAPPWPEAGLLEKLGNARQYGKHQSTTSAVVTELENAWSTISEAELTNDPAPETYIARPRIPERKTTVFSATGGTGKTTYVSSLALRRALGIPDIDGSELKPGESIILTGEDGKVDYLRKFAALRVELGAVFDAKKIARQVHILDVSGIPGVEFVRTDFGQLVVTAIPDTLAEMVKRRAPKADLIIIETISRFGAGEDNNAHAQMVKASERLCRLTGAASLLVGHVSQAAGRAGIADQFAARGGTALSDNSRSGIVMACLTPENAAKYAPGAHLTDEEMDRFVVLTHPKGMGPKAPPLLLERHANAYGPFFRLANLKVRAGLSNGALIAQLRSTVEGLTAGGVSVTARKLRDRHNEFGLSENRMEAFVDDSIKAGVLVPDKTRKTQGGGTPLVVGAITQPKDWREST